MSDALHDDDDTPKRQPPPPFTEALRAYYAGPAFKSYTSSPEILYAVEAIAGSRLTPDQPPPKGAPSGATAARPGTYPILLWSGNFPDMMRIVEGLAWSVASPKTQMLKWGTKRVLRQGAPPPV